MKSKVLISLSLVIMLAFSSCGSNADTNASSLPSELSSETDSASVQESSSTSQEKQFQSNDSSHANSDIYRPEKTFNNTTESTLAVFDSMLTAKDYPPLSTLEVNDGKEEIATGGFYNLKTVTIGDGAYMYLGETLDDQTLFSIMFFGQSDTMSDDTFERFDFYILMTLQLLGDDLSSLIDELSIDELDGISSSANSSKAHFSYSATDGQLFFSATPR